MRNVKIASILIFCLVLLCNIYIAYGSNKTLLMATTTSADNTGLLEYLAPHFYQDTGIELKWLVTGSGKALELGKKCDVDILFVHTPRLEIKYLENASYSKRAEVMYNSFMLIGPASDPANIEGMDIITALFTIKETGNNFISRGDNSGTHICETSLWNNIIIDSLDNESWYIETGQGMLATVNLCAEVGGYTIVDEGTYLKYISNLNGNVSLKVFIKGGEKLVNQYSILVVNPTRCPNCNFEEANSFLRWITNISGQNLIKNFNIEDNYLFIPNAK